MSFKRDGDDKCALDNQRKRRVTDLLYEDIGDNEVDILCNGRFVCKLCTHKPTFDTLNMFYVHRQGKKHQNSIVYAAEQRQELDELIEKSKHEQLVKAGLIVTQQDVVSSEYPVCIAQTDSMPKKRRRNRHDRKPVLDYDISCSSSTIAHCSVETTSGALLPGQRFSSCMSKMSNTSTVGEGCVDDGNTHRRKHNAGIQQLSRSCDKIGNKQNISGKYQNQSDYKQTIPGKYQNQSDYKQTIPGKYQNQSDYKQTIPGNYQNQSDYKQTIPGNYQNQSDYKQTIPGKYQNQSDYKQTIPGKYQNQSDYKQTIPGNYQNLSDYKQTIPGNYQNQSDYEQTIPGNYQNQSDYKQTIPGKYQNQSDYKQTIPGNYQNQSDYKQTIPGKYQNQSDYKQTIPGNYQNQSDYKQTIPGKYQNQSDYKQTIPGKYQNQSDYKQTIPDNPQNQSNYKQNFQGNQSASKIRNDNSMIRSGDINKLVERTNAEQRNKFYLFRKKEREDMNSMSGYRPLDTDASDHQSTVAPTQLWEYYKNYKGKVPFKMKMVDKSNKLAVGTTALKAEQTRENIETQADGKEESALCAGKKDRAEQFLNAFGSGWKRDWKGCWVKDEDAEFDSDEEPPKIS